jgi:hypothetical protein
MSSEHTEYVTDDNEVEFAKTRDDVEARTSSRHDDIRSGQALDILMPYAKAYLGLYLDIDNRNEPRHRVHLLASDELTDCIFDGFRATLVHPALPDAQAIGQQMAIGNRMATGFVVLAAMHMQLEEDGLESVMTLPEPTLHAALCYHYANKSNLPAPWVDRLIESRHDIAIPVFNALWSSLAAHHIRYMPALPHILETATLHPILHDTILPLLEQWQDCSDKELRTLLFFAFRFADHEQLLGLARTALQDEQALSIKKRVFWMATAFLLAPVEFTTLLSDYCHAQRQKILPLLDFSVDILTDTAATQLDRNPDLLAGLIRIIAPAFPRVEHMHGKIDDISSKVLWLFEQLAQCRGDRAEQAVKRLQKVRVMKIYADVLKDISTRIKG